jgi:transposase-like protein
MTNNPNRKLTPANVREIWRKAREGKWSVADLAAEFGVAKTTIGKVLRRETYPEVKIPAGPAPKMLRNPWNRVIKDEDVVEMFRLMRSGMKVSEIAAQFKVNKATVYRILYRETRTDVEIPDGPAFTPGLPGRAAVPVPDDLLRETVREVAAEERVPAHRIFSDDRDRKIVRARHAAIRRVAERSGASTPMIAAAFGMDHTTILYVLGRVAAKPLTGRRPSC